MDIKPVLGVIGGTGVYKFAGIEVIDSIEINTPFGTPSSPLVIGMLDGKGIVFISRHGQGHTIQPTDVNYHANIYALKSLGINRVIGINACGSLRQDYQPGDIIIPDQLIDFTRSRNSSFFGQGLVGHISSADPFCPELSKLAFQSLINCNPRVHNTGTMITIEGPRFSTRAESHLFRAWGISVIGMTTSPEAFLAREAELCYTSIAHITDYDVWHSTEESVNVDMIMDTLNKNTEIIQKAITFIITRLPDEYQCGCGNALEKALVSHPDYVSKETRERLKLLVGKYLS